MELILLACCKQKAAGGSPDYGGSALPRYLSAATSARLLRARGELGQRCGLPPGPDLDGTSTVGTIAYLPAYARYAGHVYSRGCVGELYPRTHGAKILVISALYGVLDAGDPIRLYEAEMGKGIAGTGRLATWWRGRGLGTIVEECILALHPRCVHDLLSAIYRSALDPWPPRSLARAGVAYVPYDYRDGGSGSQWLRGDRVRTLLSDVNDRAQVGPEAPRKPRG